MATQGCRSAGTSEKLTRFSSNHLPQVNTWVVVADTKGKSNNRRWVKAVPALVSQVSNVLVPGSAAEFRVNVLVPNVLALRHNFKAEAYRELKDVQLADVRPYPGHDQSKLQALLLNAVRNTVRKDRMQSHGHQEAEATAQGIATGTLVSPASSKRKFVDQPMDTTRENIAKFFKKCAGGESSRQPVQADAPPEEEFQVAGQADAACDKVEEATLHVAPKEMDDRTSSPPVSDCEDIHPTTPKPQRRALSQQVTPIEPELPRLREATGCASHAEKAPLDSKAAEIRQLPAPSKLAVPEIVMPADVSLSKERFLQLTRLISRGFSACAGAESEGILSKQAIADMMDKAGANLVPGELDETLKRLDAAHKIWLADELVFMA